MTPSDQFSRRDFIKALAVGSGTSLFLNSCEGTSLPIQTLQEQTTSLYSLIEKLAKIIPHFDKSKSKTILTNNGFYSPQTGISQTIDVPQQTVQEKFLDPAEAPRVIQSVVDALVGTFSSPVISAVTLKDRKHTQPSNMQNFPQAQTENEKAAQAERIQSLLNMLTTMMPYPETENPDTYYTKIIKDFVSLDYYTVLKRGNFDFLENFQLTNILPEDRREISATQAERIIAVLDACLQRAENTIQAEDTIGLDYILFLYYDHIEGQGLVGDTSEKTENYQNVYRKLQRLGRILFKNQALQVQTAQSGNLGVKIANKERKTYKYYNETRRLTWTPESFASGMKEVGRLEESLQDGSVQTVLQEFHSKQKTEIPREGNLYPLISNFIMDTGPLEIVQANILLNPKNGTVKDDNGRSTTIHPLNHTAYSLETGRSYTGAHNGTKHEQPMRIPFDERQPGVAIGLEEPANTMHIERRLQDAVRNRAFAQYYALPERERRSMNNNDLAQFIYSILEIFLAETFHGETAIKEAELINFGIVGISGSDAIDRANIIRSIGDACKILMLAHDQEFFQEHNQAIIDRIQKQSGENIWDGGFVGLSMQTIIAQSGVKAVHIFENGYWKSYFVQANKTIQYTVHKQDFSQPVPHSAVSAGDVFNAKRHNIHEKIPVPDAPHQYYPHPSTAMNFIF